MSNKNRKKINQKERSNEKTAEENDDKSKAGRERKRTREK
jgi:hypothetical protein